MAPEGDSHAVPGAGERLRLAALSCRPERLDARRIDSAETVLVRPPRGSLLPVAGESFDIEITETWRSGPQRWLSGRLSGFRLDVAALDLEPLVLVELGRWHGPRVQLAAGRPAGSSPIEYELERVPASGQVEPESALHEAIDLWAREELPAAEALLGGLLRRDLRCLDAHSCLGFFAFHAPPDSGGVARARRHYEVGLGIAALSVPESFRGVLCWSRPGNRPFLRCLYGRSICLWRQGDLAGARAGFTRLCRLNPGDQLAARVALDRIERRG